MKRSYYYFIASLPHLSFSQPEPLSYEQFLSLSSSFLYVKDFEIIKSISLSSIGDEAACLHSIKKWMVWDSIFRAQLASMRASRLGRQVRIEKGGESAVAINATMTAKEVFGISSPFHADEEIDKARWDYLDSLQWGHYFDIDWLALYSLKLLILERRATFDKEKGLQRLQDMMAGVRENYEVKEEAVEANLG